VLFCSLDFVTSGSWSGKDRKGMPGGMARKQGCKPGSKDHGKSLRREMPRQFRLGATKFGASCHAKVFKISGAIAAGPGAKIVCADRACTRRKTRACYEARSRRHYVSDRGLSILNRRTSQGAMRIRDGRLGELRVEDLSFWGTQKLRNYEIWGVYV
jgi:hypothetical protein